VNTQTGAFSVYYSTGVTDEDVVSFNSDYWLVTIKVTNDASGNSILRCGIIPAFGTTLGGYNANTAGSIVVYSAQLEEGSYPTSYIPTYGTAANRGGEVCNNTSATSLIGQTEGVLFLDFNIEDISLQTQDPVLIYLKNSSGITSYLEMYDNGNLTAVHLNSGSITLTASGLTDGRHKAAFAYKDNDFAFYVDGNLAGTNTNFDVASSQTEIGLQYTSIAYRGKQSVNQTLLFKTRLTNAELAALTTI